jgi:hypothetical protein
MLIYKNVKQKQKNIPKMLGKCLTVILFESFNIKCRLTFKMKVFFKSPIHF